MTSHQIVINVEEKDIRTNKIIILYSINLEDVLHYITLTDYYIVIDIGMTSNHMIIHVE